MRREKKARAAGLGFGVSIVASIGLAITYIAGGDPQIEGLLIGLSLGGLALGFIVWAKELMPHGGVVEERTLIAPPLGERDAAEEAFVAGADVVGRRRFLARLLTGALGALGIAALFPIRSLGSRPGRSLFHTAFEPGIRLVTADNVPVRATDLSMGEIVTVFPEGHTAAADSQTVLLRVDPSALALPDERAEWVPEGHIAYSKVCTHAGCPVGLYEPETQRLFCPCHQSVFAVLEGARPTAGPATRPLPQLPIEIDEAGYLRARSDFPEPVGPGFWNRGRA